MSASPSPPPQSPVDVFNAFSSLYGLVRLVRQ